MKDGRGAIVWMFAAFIVAGVVVGYLTGPCGYVVAQWKEKTDGN